MKEATNNILPTPEREDGTSNEEVSGAQKSVKHEIVCFAGTENPEYMLSIVPVKVRSDKGGRCIEMYVL